MKIEPVALETFEDARAEYGKIGKPVPPETMLYIVALSQAESLKRIADMIDGTTMGVCCTQTIFNPNARQQ